MRKNYVLIVVSLLISLFIYMFYRTEKTLVNEIAIAVFSADNFMSLRKTITELFPLQEHIIYSLPEGLWIFCITLTSRPFFFRSGAREINCVFIPLAFCIGMEILQFLHFINGRFDFVDIWISVIFWIIACRFFYDQRRRENILNTVNKQSIICFASYGIVYLAHVME